MRFSNVNLQAIFGFEGVLTMVTHESFLSSWSIELLPQKLFSRLRVDGVFFFFWGVETSFPLVSTEKEKLGPMLKEKEKDSDFPASVRQISRHWDASLASSSLKCDIAVISKAYF